MKILKVSENSKEKVISQAVETLKNGGVIVYPTETCYGLGVDATNPKALEKITKYKKYRGSKPVSIAVSSKEMAEEYVEINEMAENIYSNYLPGPITVISMSKGQLTPPVASLQGTTGIRYPDYPLTLDIIEAFGKPITATSANVSYKSAPYSIEQLLKDLPKKSAEIIDLVIDAGELPKNQPSTVLDTTVNQLSVLREGKQKFEDALVKNKKIEALETSSADETIQFGKQFGDKYLIEDIPVVIALSGELGAGKTQLTKGIGESLGVKEIINSPTYTIINEYPYVRDGKERTLAHMDTWRLKDDELENSGLIQNLEQGNIVVIEWADKFYQEIAAICDNMNIPIYKIAMKYLSLEERSIEVYES
jgi:L-threonylcarbamoyladenylate synthase